MNSTTALIRDKAGLCEAREIRTSPCGAPITDYDEAYALTGEVAVIRGWGRLDGTARVYRHPHNGAHALIPRQETENE